MATTYEPFVHESAEDLYALFDQQAPTAIPVAASAVPEPQRGLLAHERHMTETLERHLGQSVTLEVTIDRLCQPLYARKILLRDSEMRRVVQFGIMQIDFRCCSDAVRDEILKRETPLGHVLISRRVLRRISTHQLLEITPDSEIRSHFGLCAEWSGHVYGRLATIFCDERPAIDLLEIVAP